MKTNSIPAGLAVHARTIATTRHLLFRRACLWIGFLAFALIAFGPLPAQAAVTEAWVQRYGSEAGSEDRAYKVVTDAAGNVVVAGSTGRRTGSGSDMLVIKYSGAGVPLWTNRYDKAEVIGGLAVDGSGNVFVTGSSTLAYSSAGVPLWTNLYNGSATAVAVDARGNVFVTGSSPGIQGHEYATIAYSSAGVPLWTNRYSGPESVWNGASAMAVDASGNVFVTGWSSYASGDWGREEYATIAYSGAGVPLWTNLYNGTANHRLYNQPSAMAVDASGNVVVTGSSGGLLSSSGNSPDYATVAYSAAGVPLWTNRYNGPQNGWDYARAVAVDGSGNVFVTGWSGYSSNGGGGNDYATIAYSSAGVRLWTKSYNNGVAQAVAVDGSGNVFVTGRSDRSGGSDYGTIAYSGAGVPLWTNRYNGPGNSASALAVDGSGNVFVTGYSAGSGGDYDFATIAYSGAGAPLWTNRYGGRGDASDQASAVAVDGSGNVFVTGFSVGSGGNENYATIAYSSTGVPLWTNRYEGAWSRATDVAVDASGNAFVTGSSGGDYATIKYSGAGVPLWTNRYEVSGGTYEAIAVAVDGRGNVFVAGSRATIAYSGAGVPLWTNRYAHDWGATGLAVDGRGNVFVTGSSPKSGGGDSDYATIAYSNAGVALWTNRYNGRVNGGDHRPSAVAVDGSGNVFVTGSSALTEFNDDYYTAKYAAADGALLWERRYNGPADGRDQAKGLAVDSSGNVIVTGNSAGTSFNEDYYTAKYAAADGALLWEKRYNGPANSSDLASAVAVNSRGNVVVTGRSDVSETMFGSLGGDYYTAKYAAADGATLWEKRYNGPMVFFADRPRSLALGPNGMIAIAGMIAAPGSSSGDFLTLVYREVPTISIDLISTGVRLRFTGLPGSTYDVERAPVVTGPWSPINTQTAPASGFFEYLDANSPTAAAFYRTHEP